MEYVCTEPTSENMKDWVQVAKSSDKIKFPSVDSCLAVLYLFEGGMIGGHVGMLWPGDSKISPRNANKLLNAMTGQLILVTPYAKVDKIVFIGDITRHDPSAEEWNIDDLIRVCTMTIAGKPIYATYNKVAGAVDIIADGQGDELSVYRSKGSRRVLSEKLSAISAGHKKIQE